MNERPFNCCNCTLNFKRRHHLERHLNTHSEITRSQALKHIANFNNVKDVMNVTFKPIKKVSFGPLPERKVSIKPLPNNVKSNIKIRIKCLQQKFTISDKQYKPINQPPVYQPPVYQKPVYQPPEYQPPEYQPPEYQPPVYKNLSDLLLKDDDEIPSSFPEEEKECCKNITDDLEYICHITYEHKYNH
jgi:hypothetical protein